MNRSARLVFTCAYVGLLALCSCSSEDPRIREVHRLAPNAPAPVLRHLMESDDSTLGAYAQEVGFRALLDCVGSLYSALQYDSPGAYEHSARVLMPLLLRLSSVAESNYGHEGVRKLLTAQNRMAAADILEHGRLLAEQRQLSADTSLSIGELSARYAHMADRWRDMGMTSFQARAVGSMALAYRRTGDDERFVEFLRDAIRLHAESGTPNMACQYLGVLGAYWRAIGQIDSMRVAYDAGLDIAHRYRMPHQAGRLISFYATYYRSMGRTALARNMYQQAIDVCREYRGGFYELRFLLELMEMYADTGQWETVGLLMPRARVIMRLPLTYDAFGTIWILRVRRLHMAYLIAMGQLDQARSEYQEIKGPIRQFLQPYDYAELQWRYARGLIDRGHIDAGLAIIDRTIEESNAAGDDSYVSSLYLARADGCRRRGDIDAARGALRQFEGTAPQRAAGSDEWSEHDVQRIECALAERDTTLALTEIAQAARHLEDGLSSLDPGSQGYTWLDGRDDLRQLLHDVVAHDPSLGYGVEFYWRHLYRVLGSGRVADGAPLGSTDGTAAAASEESILAKISRYATRARASVAGAGATHCVYLFRRGEVWRWTCRGGRVTRETLPLPTGAFETLVRKTQFALASDPGDADKPIDPILAADLGTLATFLLPPGDSSPHRDVTPLWVTAEGFLSSFPFGTLNMEPNGPYAPLLLFREVVYVRHFSERQGRPPAPAGGVIVADPLLPCPSESNVFGGQLKEARAEGKASRQLGREALLLCGSDATKTRVLSAWQSASIIYAAMHMCRDTESPFSALIPLARGDEDVGPNANYVDVYDVRTTGLSDCHLVVLSGCSSGVPFVGSNRTAPSLVDAFLDAGAAHVIQTFWEVSDDVARDTMEEYISAAEVTFGDAAALNAARRHLMKGPGGTRHPYLWAAYSMQTARGVPE